MKCSGPVLTPVNPTIPFFGVDSGGGDDEAPPTADQALKQGEGLIKVTQKARGDMQTGQQTMEPPVNAYNPIDVLFGGMEKLGPGSNVHTLHVLGLLPKRPFRVIVDAGCGTGRQTIVLAKELGTLVHAVDSYEPFLNDLLRRAEEARIGHLVQTHCMDMKNIPDAFPHIDLLWSEGAAYNIGFSDALTTWAAAISKGGFAVVSELSWLRE